MTARGEGLLLLYHRPTFRRDAAAVWEHIDAFRQHSRFPVWSVNTEGGFPVGLRRIRFAGIVLHYSLFGGETYGLSDNYYEYLDRATSSYKVAFFQDEYRYCRKRFDLLDRYRVDCVYTLLEPRYFEDTYRKYAAVPKLVHNIPGYVSDELVMAARRLGKAPDARDIDVGYRGRRLEYYMGRGGQEKAVIGEEFRARTRGRGLRVDIETEERDRLYGDDWYRFLAECRGCLGVEAGVSVFDVEDVVREACERLVAREPHIGFEEIFARVLAPWENNIFYRTISPRHFEAAAFRVCQILFEGRYSGILQPMVHYLPLKKDFSNLDEVIRYFADAGVRRDLTENAYRDLIASGRYSYRRFVEGFDAELTAAGFQPGPADDSAAVEALLAAGGIRRRVRAAVLGVRFFGDRIPRPLMRVLRPMARKAFGHVTGFR